MTDKFYPDDITTAAAHLLASLRGRGRQIATVESCTGGLIAGALTEVPGSSDVVVGGFVSYANTAKMAMVGVPGPLLDRHGAVSAEVAEAMARGALDRLPDAWATISVTGVAGPGGGSAIKPVGLVYMAVAWREPNDKHCRVERHHFSPTSPTAEPGMPTGADPLRTAIRLDTVRAALKLVDQVANEPIV